MAIDVDTLQQGFARGGWLPLAPPGHPQPMVPESLLPEGDGVLVSSGGSSGGRQICLQPWSHLDQSATATALWLQGIGLDPSETLSLNPLPLHHVSGLMPWWRSRCWGAQHQILSKELMKTPSALRQMSSSSSEWREHSLVLSLVPTQLTRLMGSVDGVEFLKAVALIWVGGAALPRALADQARSNGLRLAPCYGATETAAMVTALHPDQFLAGEEGCGGPLCDVQLRLANDGSLSVRTKRLALASWSLSRDKDLQVLADQNGWWRSGDAAVLGTSLRILGRVDGAILSGGETIFPEQLEARLMQQVVAAGLPPVLVLMLSVRDLVWGERLVALVGSSDENLTCVLESLAKAWLPAERPKAWISCPNLQRSVEGKWRRDEWRDWLRSELKHQER